MNAGDVFIKMIDQDRISQWFVKHVNDDGDLESILIDDEGCLSDIEYTFNANAKGIMKDPLASRLFLESIERG